ncbi:MAG TPA: hypothetical protein VHL11_24205, partial [Phototrophicaceae bacterium]|nr:hypothetical protein [Phototrophicaceae bacterium]
MSDDQFTPEEQQLVDLMQHTAHPHLGSRVSETIRQLLLTEMDNPSPESVHPVKILRPSSTLYPVYAAAAAILVVIALFIVLSNRQSGPLNTSTSTPLNQVALHNTNTIESSVTAR